MMADIVVIETTIAFVTEIGFVHETAEGTASIEVFTLFEEAYDFVGFIGSLVDDHVGWIHRHDFDLVVGECCLKLLEFGYTARPFRYASLAM